MKRLGHSFLEAALLAAALLTLTAGRLAAAEIHVSAAASLADALNEIKAGYEKTGGDTLVLNLGASSTLERQIEEGAPADVFLSADEAKMDQLAKKNLLVAATRKSVLGNTLVVVVPLDSPLKVARPSDITDPKIKVLALAEPSSVPAGIYAKEYLTRLKLWEQVSARVVPTENVRTALAAVESGNADEGIVYKTDAGISKKVKIAYEVPAAEGPKISYPFAVLAESKHQAEARKFLAYLESPASVTIFKKYGFLIQ
ncbi:MAG TPA: molybdate ABC transporter substrate-binding protein [Thermoanaerobaculia bacterium]|jgi:molybdate transport system substrate-binding protein|nr:molybdate ABC transporter substrate-binding protein [Thermoanaerobaculia bacterium]